MNRLKNKNVLITGGTSGFGFAIADLFLLEGANVVITARRKEKGTNAENKLRSNTKGNIKYIQCDIINENEVKKLINKITFDYKKIDVLINNAGSMTLEEFENISEETWDRIMNVNLKGCFLITKHMVPFMIKNKKGSIINISSILGLVGKGYNPLYSASKGGVTLLSKSLALRYAKYNIKVNCICPGTIITELNRDRIDKSKDPKKALNDIIAEYPMGCLGEPIDVAYAALYLASDESKWVTGISLPVDGGYTAGK